MPDLSPFQYGLITNMMSLCIAAMFAGALFFFFSRETVGPKYRPALLISALVPAIAAYHYFRIYSSFKGAYIFDGDMYVASGQTFNDAYRYADWLLTVPLLVIELVAVCALAKAVSRRLSTQLSVAAVIMIALGYPGEVATSARVAWIWWALAMVPFAYILWTLYGEFGRAVENQPQTAKPLISKARALILITWSFYPLAFLAPLIGFSGGTGETVLQVGYTLADITAKVGLGIFIYWIARAKTEADEVSIEVSHGGSGDPVAAPA